MILKSLQPGVDDDVVHRAGVEDEAAGFCGPPMSWGQLLAVGRPFRLIRRFVITQGSGKKRVIDDALSGGQSYHSHDSNHLQFCSALQPCIHLHCLAQAVQDLLGTDAAWPDDVLSAGEDLPSAYRKMPMILTTAGLV